MYSKELEELIDAALADGVLTEKKKQILFKRAKAQGIDLDEFEMVLDARALKVQQSQTAHPAKEKLGNIVTCPNCGANIPGGAAVCPECGHEFRNIKANHSVKRFSEGLQAINNEIEDEESFMPLAVFNVKKRKSPLEEYITTFPVPNTSEDLLEFLSFVQGQAVKHDSRLMSMGGVSASIIQEHAYWILFEKCINKAQINFRNDPRFTPYFAYYKEQSKKGNAEEIQRKKVLLYCGIGMLVCLFLFYLASLLE